MRRLFHGQLAGLIAPVYVPMLLLSFAIAAPSAIFPQYLLSLGAGIALSGVIVSLRFAGNLATDLPGGLVLGRARIRGVMAAALSTAAVSAVGMALARSVFAVSVWVFLSGASTSVVVTACMTYVRRTIGSEIRGRALSLIGGSVRIGALLGPVAGGVLADAAGYQAALWLRAAATVTALLLFVAGSRSDAAIAERPVTNPQAAEQGMAARMRVAYSESRERLGAVIVTGAGIFVLQLLRASRTVILPLWGESLGLSASLIGTVMSLGGAFDVALFLPAGIIMDRAGRKTAASLCTGGFAAGVLLLGFSTGVPGFVIAALVIGLGNGFGAGINMTMGTDLAPNGAISEFLGAWRVIGDAGSAAGPAVAGVLTAAVTLTFGVFALSGIGLLGFVIFALAAPETLTIARGDERRVAAREPSEYHSSNRTD